MWLQLTLAFACFFAVSAQLLPPSGIRITRPGPVIRTNVGDIQGQHETYDIFRRIYTFKGIRYGQPPIGDLRFRQAQPALPYATLHKAWEYGSVCPQMSVILSRFQGDEDCLFLNIATPTSIRRRLPVTIFIHGGALQFGDGEMDQQGPEFMVESGVVYVSLNHRLNVLGFLSTNDGHSPGNYGLKDIILALRWIQSNIAFFGGDPDNVTIMGISGGAVAVHALVVSPAASGLFHKALSQSGSLFNNWAINQNPLLTLQRLVERLQIHSTGIADLMNQLRQVSIQRLVEAVEPFNQDPTAANDDRFMPVMDTFETVETVIFPAPIEMMIRQGPINLVPYVIGFNGEESLSAYNSALNDPRNFERFNQNPHLIVPHEWNLQPGSVEAANVIQVFREIYFDGATTLTAEHAWGWSQYISDRRFIFGISKQARLHDLRQNVFYFRFSYVGALSLQQRTAGLGHLPGAMHGDDAFYLFRMNVAVTPVPPSDPAFEVQRRYVRLWTNFFKYGNPTPTTLDPLIATKWPMKNITETFMDIGRKLKVDVHPNRDRMDIWHALDQLFNQMN